MPFNPDALFGNYARPANTYDSLWDESGRIRQDWEPLFNSLQKLGKEELSNRFSEIQRLLRENGVTYNVYGDPDGLYRPWKLDALPFIINKEEWETIETALIQRARLLNLVLTDIYGKRTLIKEGHLPLELIYNHNGFLRPCDGVQIPGENQLLMYAADIAKDKDGRMWVMNDRTQAPSGSGYALENRSVMAKAIPEFLHGYQIRKLNDFFNSLLASLNAIAPHGIVNPRIVLLTPGPGNETYFEHAYLSAYLGFNLVQGQDLTVRDGFVWLKTIQGLERIDIILRRVDDSFCDPLELRLDSQLGVPGLLEAVRMGNVVVANPLGSSILENSGLMAFLPGLCKHFFNEDLLLPSVNTWWCGQPKELSFVLENLDKLTIKMIHRREGSRTISEGQLDKKQLEDLKKTILSKPYLYVAHAQIAASTTPSLINGDPETRFAVLRCFLIAKNGDYIIMPGGLTRSSSEKDVFKVSNQYGGISKDTWVLSQEKDEASKSIFLPFTPFMKENLKLPSRTAENVFWAGRYATRAKTTARFLKEVYQHLNGIGTEGANFENEAFRSLLVSLTHLTMTYPGFIGEEGKEKLNNPAKELLFIMLANENSGTLASTIQYFKRSIFAVRNRWPADTWHIIDDIDESWKRLERASAKNFFMVQNTLENVTDSLTAFMGLNLESIPRDDAYVLLNMGRRIEKGLLLISQIRSVFVVPKQEAVEYSLMETLLSCNMSLNIYRSRFRSYLQLEAFIDLMIFDVTNPSSLLHQLEQIRNNLPLLPGRNRSGRLSGEEKLIIEAYAAIQKYEPAFLQMAETDSGMRKSLDELLAKVSSLLSQISDLLVAGYFTHSELSPQLYGSVQESDI
jgi:uncharacterized circularly permuted ATP-grasp superfamily protein/uncharacterized alpha-E superfamily protein